MTATKTIPISEYPEIVKKLLDRVDFKAATVELSPTGTYRIIGRSNDWIGYHDLRILSTFREVINITVIDNRLCVGVSL